MPGKAEERNVEGGLSSTQGDSTYNKLLHLVGIGSSHVTTAAELARTIEDDFKRALPPKLKQLANCGARGACDGNIERDFQRMVKGAYGFEIEPYTIQLTLEDPQLIDI